MTTYRSQTTYPLMTPIGEVLVTPVDGDAVYVDGSSHGRYVTLPGGVRLAVSFSYSTTTTPNHVYTERCGADYRKAVTATMERKALAVLVPAVRAWVEANADLMSEAAGARANNHLYRLNADIAAAEVALNALRAERDALLYWPEAK